MNPNIINLSDFELTTSDLLGSDAMRYGSGVFETLYVSPQGIEHFEAHLDRLEQGAAALGIFLPDCLTDRSALHRKLCALLDRGEEPCSLRLQLTKTGEKTLFWGQFRSFDYKPEQYRQGFKVGIKATNLLEADALSAFKHTSYLRHWQARFDLKARGYDEYLWLNPKGRLTEGTVSNYFFLKEGIWHTPSLSEGILPGVMRAAILASMDQKGVKIREGSFALADVEAAEALFLSNALMAVMPVCQLGEKTFEVDFALTQWLYQLLGLKRNLF